MNLSHSLHTVALTLFAFSLPLFAQSANLQKEDAELSQNRFTSENESSPLNQAFSSVENVAPYTSGQKLRYELSQSFGVYSLLASAMAAGVYQKTNTPSEWGDDLSGYGQRYASFLGTSGARSVFAFALESSFHQDPRYFPSLQHGFKARVGGAIKQAFVAHTDTGTQQFAYARIGSAFGAAYLANTWNPAGNCSVMDGAQRAGFIIASDVGWNLIQEFMPFTRPKAFRHLQP